MGADARDQKTTGENILNIQLGTALFPFPVIPNLGPLQLPLGIQLDLRLRKPSRKEVCAMHDSEGGWVDELAGFRAEGRGFEHC